MSFVTNPPVLEVTVGHDCVAVQATWFLPCYQLGGMDPKCVAPVQHQDVPIDIDWTPGRIVWSVSAVKRGGPYLVSNCAPALFCGSCVGTMSMWRCW
jgi:hypothetical protein